MDKQQINHDDIAYFIAFCIELYKNANGMTGRDVSRLFSETGLSEFLATNFEPIHTQNPRWILEEINEYLSTHE